MNICLKNNVLNVEIKPKGAELCSLRYLSTQELLWQAEPAFWPRHAPILFPIVGRLRQDVLRFEGKAYPLSQHGFARDLPFEVVDHHAQRASLRLRSNTQTRARYPFDFELAVNYQLEEDSLHVDYILRNNSNRVLPASIGAHPAFRWPLTEGSDKTDYLLEFECQENAPLRRLREGLLTDDRYPCPIRDKKLPLKPQWFEQDAMIFTALNSRKLRYSGPGDVSIEMRFDDFPHLGIWSKPGADFVCIEPWQGHASPEDDDGDFCDKPGIVRLAAYSERGWRHSIRVVG